MTQVNSLAYELQITASPGATESKAFDGYVVNDCPNRGNPTVAFAFL